MSNADSVRGMVSNGGGQRAATMPSVNAMGTRPLSGSPYGNNGRGMLGVVLPTGLVATGRYGGSRSSVGRNPLTGRGRDRGR